MTKLKFFSLLAGWPFLLDFNASGQNESFVKYQTNYPPRISSAEAAHLKFKTNLFTFVRIKYGSVGRRSSSWSVDYPDADLNFTHELARQAGIAVNTNGLILELTDPRLKQHPFIYIAEGGDMQLTPAEARALRDYLNGGGFLMVDDFWGEVEWAALARLMAEVFPDLKPVDLSLEHAIFNCFYRIQKKPQVPSIAFAIRGREKGITWEREDGKEPHYRGLIDAQGRLMAVLCHNTDLADGWERVGEDPFYARDFSYAKAFPMGINLVIYALTR